MSSIHKDWSSFKTQPELQRLKANCRKKTTFIDTDSRVNFSSQLKRISVRFPLTSWTWPGPWDTGRGWGIEAECVVWSCCHSTEGPSTAERDGKLPCVIRSMTGGFFLLSSWLKDWKNWLSHWWGTWQSRHGLQQRSSSPSSSSSTLACHPAYSSWTQLESHLNTAHRIQVREH